MSKLRDKLSANMRTVKANQSQTPAKAAPGKTTPTPPAPAKTAAPVRPKARSAASAAPASGKTVPGDVPDSGAALFPTRVWPD